MYTENDDLLHKYYREISNEKPLTRKEETTLINKAQSGDEKALQKLIKANLKFVVSVAKSYQNQGHPLSDLINDGNLGLINAVNRFDTSSGYKFISYAVWWVREAINTSLNETSRMVRIPVNHINRIKNSKKAINDYISEHGKLPELGDELNNGEVVDTFLLINSYSCESLDNSISEDENLTYLDGISSEPEDLVLDKNKIDKELYDLMDDLEDREREIIIKYYGLLNKESKNLNELSEEYGITLQRVRQIKDKGIRKLRHNSKRLYGLIKEL